MMKNHKIMLIFASVQIKHTRLFKMPRRSTWVSFIVMLNKALKEDWWFQETPRNATLGRSL
jgi:hypothetical protein